MFSTRWQKVQRTCMRCESHIFAVLQLQRSMFLGGHNSQNYSDFGGGRSNWSNTLAPFSGIYLRFNSLIVFLKKNFDWSAICINSTHTTWTDQNNRIVKIVKWTKLWHGSIQPNANDMLLKCPILSAVIEYTLCAEKRESMFLHSLPKQLQNRCCLLCS